MTQAEKNTKIDELQKQIVDAEKAGTDTTDLKAELKVAQEAVVE
jgi:hypothetical protein